MDQDDGTKKKDGASPLSLFDEINALLDHVPELTPAMPVLTGLDTSKQGDTAKRDQAKNYVPLTHPVPLTTLAPATDLMAHLNHLQTCMPNFTPVIQFLQTQFALASLGGTAAVLKLRPTLLVGPHGIGKTRFVKLLADALDAPWSYLSAAGDADNRRFAGTASGYSTAQAAWPVDQILRLNCANPILVIDELDKTSNTSSNGQLIHSLLPLLETDTAKLFSDPFLGGQADLSAISWVILVNTTEGLSNPLLSRVAKFEIKPPDLAEFDAIVAAIITDIASEKHLDPTALPPLPGSFLAGLKAAYARVRDVRRLKSAIERALGLLVRLDNDPTGLTIH